MKIDLRQNGYIKIRSERTGTEVRFHIKTEKQARNLYPPRGGEAHWLKIGEVLDGRVKLTSYHAGREVSQLYRDMLNDPTNPRYSGFSYEQEARCNLCNRKLKNTFSIWRGYGPDCAKYMKG